MKIINKQGFVIVDKKNCKKNKKIKSWASSQNSITISEQWNTWSKPLTAEGDPRTKYWLLYCPAILTCLCISLHWLSERSIRLNILI